MPEPSECVDRAESSGWLFLMLEISENLALDGPPAQVVLNHVELRFRVSTLTESVAHKRSSHNVRRLQILALGNTERNTMTPQYSIHFVAEPCVVAKFESHPQSTHI
jgi:hypothetical protein